MKIETLRRNSAANLVPQGRDLLVIHYYAEVDLNRFGKQSVDLSGLRVSVSLRLNKIDRNPRKEVPDLRPNPKSRSNSNQKRKTLIGLQSKDKAIFSLISKRFYFCNFMMILRLFHLGYSRSRPKKEYCRFSGWK